MSLFEDPDGVTKIISQQLVDILTTILFTEKYKMSLALTLRLLNNILASEQKYKEGILKQNGLMDKLFSICLSQNQDIFIVTEACHCLVSVLMNSNKTILMEYLRNEYFVNIFRILTNWKFEFKVVSVLTEAIIEVLDYGERIKSEFRGVNPVLTEIEQKIDFDEFFGEFKKNPKIEKRIEILQDHITSLQEEDEF